MIAIVDFGLGNLRSIEHKLRRLGYDARISADERTLRGADALILSGVGHFARGMSNLERRGLIPVLHRLVREESLPVFGICLGMQMFTEYSEEGGVPGLGWIRGRTRRFRFDDRPDVLPVPHMGWNTVTFRNDHPVFSRIMNRGEYYFIHSYHVECDDAGDVRADTRYGYHFPSIIGRGNILGTQFHPEKSHRKGLELLAAFLNARGGTAC